MAKSPPEHNDSGFTPQSIVECVQMCILSRGLKVAMDYFDGMERILSALPGWSEVKDAAELLFIEAREKLEEREMAITKAGAPRIQVNAKANSGMENIRAAQLNAIYGQKNTVEYNIASSDV